MTAIRTNISLGDTVSVIDNPEMVGIVEMLANRDAMISRDGELSVFPIYFLEKIDPKTVTVDFNKTKKETTTETPKTINCCKKCHQFFNRGGHVTMEHVKRRVKGGWKVIFDTDCFVCANSK